MLFVVATPIGNLGDLTRRAREILEAVDLVAAEDTRRTAKLLASFNASTPIISYRAHNEAEMAGELVGRMKAGERIALVSDAGTPLVSDPGFSLVDQCLAAGVPVVPVPGPSAAVCAVSVAGIPGQGFTFEGFLPAKKAARRARLDELKRDARPLVFYEAPHRIESALADMAEVLGGGRNATVCRELTKKFEQIIRAPLSTLCKLVGDEMPARGEFAIVVDGGGASRPGLSLDAERLVAELLKELPPSKVAGIAARVTGESRQRLYELALELNGKA